MSPADLADLRRRTPKQQNSLNLKLIVFLCDIMQPAAFLCVICVICGRIHIQTYSINIHRRNPSISRWSRRFTQTKPQNHKTALTSPPHQPVFLCVIMQPRCIPLRDLRYLRENTRKSTQSISTNETPEVSRRFRRFTQTKPKNNKTAITPKQQYSNNLSFSAI